MIIEPPMAKTMRGTCRSGSEAQFVAQVTKRTAPPRMLTKDERVKSRFSTAIPAEVEGKMPVLLRDVKYFVLQTVAPLFYRRPRLVPRAPAARHRPDVGVPH